MPAIATTYQIKPTYLIDTSDLMWTPVGDPNGTGYYIEGTEAADTLYGSQLADAIYGLGGDDVLYGQDGKDRLSGGLGNDSLDGGTGADVLDGGDGIDWASYAGSTAVTVDLRDRGFGGQAEGDTYTNIENVFGSGFGDLLLGNAVDNMLDGRNGNDQLFGDFGNDRLDGGAGQDRLEGGFGKDILDGGLGNDVLVGGEGADKFMFRPSSGGDTIVDFQLGVDTIVLNILGGRGPTSDTFVRPFGDDNQLARGSFHDGVFIGTGLDASDDIIYLTNTNQLISVESLTATNDHWTVQGATLLATLNVDVSQSDFLLV
jgi:Ca2+-binding RTX toxin-like protein